MDSLCDDVLDTILSMSSCLGDMRLTCKRWMRAVRRIQWTHECVVYKLRLWQHVCPRALKLCLMHFDENDPFEEAALRGVRDLCVTANVSQQLLASLTNLKSLVLQSPQSIYDDFTPPPNLTKLVVNSRFHLYEGEMFLWAHFECCLKDLSVNLRHLEAPTSLFCPFNVSRMHNLETLILSIGCDELQDKHFANLCLLRVLQFGRAPLLTVNALSHLALDDAKGPCPGICGVSGNVTRLTVLRAAIYSPQLKARRIHHLDIYGDFTSEFVESVGQVDKITVRCDVPNLCVWALRAGAYIHYPPGY